MGKIAGPRGGFIIDETGFPNQGEHSVGLQRQYCGAAGQGANCQVAVSIHYVSQKGPYPWRFVPTCPRAGWEARGGWTGPGSPRRPAVDSPRPVSLIGLAGRTTHRKVTWREGTEGTLSARFA